MQYRLPGSIIISFVGGTFGNALAHLIMSSQTNELYHPIDKTFHQTDWPFDFINCLITNDSTINWNKEILPNDIVQVHCANADILAYKFPSSKLLLLTCDNEYYAIQRQWQVLNTDDLDKFETILSAYNWVTYNLDYLNSTGRQHNNSAVLSIDFSDVANRLEDIEDFLQLKFLPEPKEIYTAHIEKQMKTFYEINSNFKFAWDVYSTHGSKAPIVDLTNEFLS